MPKYEVGDHLLVKLTSSRIVEATVKAVIREVRRWQVAAHREARCESRAIAASIRRWQKIFDVQHLAAFALNRCVAEGIWPLLAKKVNDAIACHEKKPAGDMLDRHQRTVSFHQFVEDLLHDVLCCIGGIGHTTPNEIARQGSLFRDDLGDSTVLLGHPRDPLWLIHLLS
jgi:hypothetical protein